MKNTTARPLIILVWALCLSFTCSLFAEYFWLFDLFSHFLMQYLVGGALFTILLTSTKRYKTAILTLLIAMASLYQSRLPLQAPYSFTAPPAISQNTPIKLVQYNHNIGKTDFKDISDWLKQNADDLDVIVFQEASVQTVNAAKSLLDIYPYQIHQPRPHAFGMVVISRHALEEQQLIPLKGPVFQSFAIKATVNIPNTDKPLTLYALHAVPPMTFEYFTQRNLELQHIAETISKDTNEHIAMIGDWNITPYSPYFSKLLDTSGLHYKSNGLFQNPSWPNFTLFNFLKIPIDHTLFSPSLRFTNKKVESNFGSDHHAIITTLELPKNKPSP